MTELKEAGLPPTLTRNDFVSLLSMKYPHISWESVYLLRGKFAQQKRLQRAVTILFPVRYDARFLLGNLDPLTKSRRMPKSK